MLRKQCSNFFITILKRKETFRNKQRQEQRGEAKTTLGVKRSTINYNDVDIFGDDTINIKMETDEIEEFGKTAKNEINI